MPWGIARTCRRWRWPASPIADRACAAVPAERLAPGLAWTPGQVVARSRLALPGPQRKTNAAEPARARVWPARPLRFRLGPRPARRALRPGSLAPQVSTHPARTPALTDTDEIR